MNSPIYLIVNMLINFGLLALFLRFMMQFADINPRHPYMLAVRRFTGVVDVFSRIFPNVMAGRISLAAIALMLLLYWVNLVADAFILQESLTALQVFFIGTIQAIIKFLAMLRYIILASVVASWVIMLANVMHPALELVMALSEPIIAPFRRIVPNLGMLDLSPIAALFGLLLLQKFVEIVAMNILQGIA
ncbi:YggT family protein [Moraxella nasovis]|uniref:YggT family protein n=1 Tax=Moraxella nasovis TaxID=2904121 RepID=UPI001F62420B|nr:YggT family protein [Moraxella nasovis]UNU73930.1 YggT family protein [Moraxella nasovis]